MSLSKDLINLLKSEGATGVGFANLKGVNNVPSGYISGVSIFVKLSKEAIKSINTKNNTKYIEEYKGLDKILDKIALKGEEYLKSKGYKAEALTSDKLSITEDNASQISFEEVATRGGLGWIGKSCLLINPDYGSAIKLITILTSAPLTYAKPVKASLCGMCTECRDSCKPGAINGILWNTNTSSDTLFNHKKCLKHLKKLSKKQSQDEGFELCSQCVYVCPKTQNYIK
ncbi:hypothetical protein ACA135_05755 [Methanobrevibacter acididurans]|uniref:hypothetical protein n=1 Tax=Methanobrevibacter acididurans TaxID=120963 RepID=UPI0038FBF5CB